ncbi:UNVERIFIED_CONTAM: 2,3-bisphosphoglycerate-independent phosphoglycerate mutase [Sesamum angustifolium]|uniref:phosphoglycerate mutase (2,3-diphosphoglycerate-independent) n=1 Tax=Sesamum angustifolium TaxID=2727405 RepID=A0AAW2ISI9_9LAMI
MGSSGFSWKLKDHPKLPKGKTIAVVVLDGWGEATPNEYNCIHVADTPTMDSLKKGAPERWRLVRAHGTAVGLPTDDDMGNSEVGHNALGAGRIYAQGLDQLQNDWDVVKRGWDAQVLGEAPHKFKSAVEAVKKLREIPNINDQYLPPFVIVDDNGKATGPIVDGDAVVTFNFRADRMVMIAKALEYKDFDKFDRVRFPKIHYAGMLQYDGELKLPSHYLVSPPEIERTSGEYLVHNGIRTFACSETVKFGHVTFFWNGNRSGYFNPEMEEYVEIPSDSGITFNVQPKMKALEIAEKARDAILSCKFDQMILDAIEQVGGIYVVTADHGNAEDMVKRNKKGEPLLDKNGNIQILTSHTLQPVPIAIGGPGLAPGVRFRQDIPNGGLANVAATVMSLHGFEAPDDYEPTLIEVVDK